MRGDGCAHCHAERSTNGSTDTCTNGGTDCGPNTNSNSITPLPPWHILIEWPDFS